MIYKSYCTFKCRSIYNTTGSDFLQYQQVLVTCYQIMGMGFNSKCQQIVVGFVLTRNLVFLGMAFTSYRFYFS